MIKVSEIKIRSKVDWNSINWRKIQLRIWRIQRKIYDCSKRSEKFKVIKLQKTLISLLEAKFLAVRKVTQDNRGRALGNRAFSKLIICILCGQDNKCNLCGLRFLPGDVIEIDHIVPKVYGGANHYGNLQAFHGHCHDQKL